MELSGEDRLRMAPARCALLQILPESLVVAEQAHFLALQTQPFGLLHGQPCLAATRPTSETDPRQVPGCGQQDRLALRELVLTVLQFLRLRRIKVSQWERSC